VKRSQAEALLESLVERLAAIEHERWSDWQRHVHELAERRSDGSIVLSHELVQRWDAQIVAAYSDLSENEKDSDREQVRRYLPVIVDALAHFND
jgi:hypothetical protein